MDCLSGALIGRRIELEISRSPELPFRAAALEEIDKTNWILFRLVAQYGSSAIVGMRNLCEATDSKNLLIDANRRLCWSSAV